MWTIDCASPVSRTSVKSVKSVEMLAFAYIRTGTTADRRTDQNGFEVETSASTAIA
jgi:hypothetical protein